MCMKVLRLFLICLSYVLTVSDTSYILKIVIMAYRLRDGAINDEDQVYHC